MGMNVFRWFVGDVQDDQCVTSTEFDTPVFKHVQDRCVCARAHVSVPSDTESVICTCVFNVRFDVKCIYGNVFMCQ